MSDRDAIARKRVEWRTLHNSVQKKFLTKEAGGDKNPACIVNTADGRIFTVAY